MSKPNEITLTDDYALSRNTSLEILLPQYIHNGYKIVNQYNHPAVGKVIVLTIGSR